MIKVVEKFAWLPKTCTDGTKVFLNWYIAVVETVELSAIDVSYIEIEVYSSYRPDDIDIVGEEFVMEMVLHDYQKINYMVSGDAFTSIETVRKYNRLATDGLKFQVRLKIDGEYSSSFDNVFDIFHQYKVILTDEIRRKFTDILVKNDIQSIKEDLSSNNTKFLEDILSGSGWIPYNQLTSEQLVDTYYEIVYDI